MAVEQFHNQEREYATYLRQGLAFVCNGMDMGPEWRRLHRTDCPMLSIHPSKIKTSVAKACSRDLRELTSWLTSRLGPEGSGFTFCSFCQRAGRL